MKSHALKTRKSTVRQQRKSASSEATVIRRKIKKSFAEQVNTFIERYRPALEALAKR